MQIKDWPLGPHAEATLVAVGSPDAQGRGRQWRTHAYFVDPVGETFDLRLSWGLLPKLRPGSVFVNGYLTGHAVALEALDIDINVEPQLVSWAEATRGESGWMRSRALQDEHCLTFPLARGRVVVPCVQVLRAFHAQTRMVSHAILRPLILSELATGELRGDEARLHIAPLIPQGTVTKAFGRYLAKLLFERPWLDSFSDVFHRRFAEAERSLTDKHDRIPLQCFPPQAPWWRWSTVGHYLASGDFFISDLVSTLSGSKPPYRTLTIFHNKKGPPPKNPDTALTVDNDEGDGREKPSRSGGNEDPKGVGRPSLVRQRVIEHGDSDPARVFDVYPGRKPGGAQKGGGGEKGEGKSQGSQAPLSLDDERRPGGRTSAEFLGIPGRDTTPLHFEIFIKAFRDAIESRRGWELHFSIEALSAYVPDCQPHDRLVMFGRLKTPNALGYLIELEPLEGQASYTLAVVRRNEPEAATVKEIGARLSRWLTGFGRSHVSELLKHDPDYRVMLSTHRDLGGHKWVRRILEKIDPPEKRPAWTRGIAG